MWGRRDREGFPYQFTNGRPISTALRELRKVFSAQELIHHFVRATGERKEDVLRRGKNSRERAMLMELLYRFCQISQPEIGRIVGGIDYINPAIKNMSYAA